jgi:toxin ParE1/3/4
MRSVRLRYTPLARADIAEIYAYIASSNPAAATKVVQRIREAAGNLAEQPRLGHKTHLAEIRSFPVTPYSYVIYYAARNQELAIRHGARAAPTASDLL